MHYIFSNWITICCLFAFKGLILYQSANFFRLASNQAFNSSSEFLISVSVLKTYKECLAVCLINGACEMVQVDNTECRLYSCIKSDLVSRQGSFVYAKSNSSASSVPCVSTTTTNSTTSKYKRLFYFRFPIWVIYIWRSCFTIHIILFELIFIFTYF